MIEQGYLKKVTSEKIEIYSSVPSNQSICQNTLNILQFKKLTVPNMPSVLYVYKKDKLLLQFPFNLENFSFSNSQPGHETKLLHPQLGRRLLPLFHESNPSASEKVSITVKMFKNKLNRLVFREVCSYLDTASLLNFLSTTPELRTGCLDNEQFWFALYTEMFGQTGFRPEKLNWKIVYLKKLSEDKIN